MNEREQKIADARSVLDFLEANPGLPLHWYLSGPFNYHAPDAGTFLQWLAIMGDGKVDILDSMVSVRDFPECSRITVNISKDAFNGRTPDLDALAGLGGIIDIPPGIRPDPTPAECPHGIARLLPCGQCGITAAEGRKAKRIRVISGESWYIDRVGLEFSVYGENLDCYRVTPEHMNGDFIRKESAEVIQWADGIPDGQYADLDDEGPRYAKIIKASSPSFWYASRIGQSFLVLGTGLDNDWLVEVAGNNEDFFVGKADCEVSEFPF